MSSILSLRSVPSPSLSLSLSFVAIIISCSCVCVYIVVQVLGCLSVLFMTDIVLLCNVTIITYLLEVMRLFIMINVYFL